MRRVLRVFMYLTYPFMGLSLLLFMGMTFGAAFLTTFTVENRTGVPVVVTPVGTPEYGGRGPLPVMMFSFLPVPAFRGGGYRLGPGESVKISYDSDDIRLSEIVVWTGAGGIKQLATAPPPGAPGPGGALGGRYLIDDLAALGPAAVDVERAAQAAGRQWVIGGAVDSLLVGPWVAYGVLAWLVRRGKRREKAGAAGSVALQRR